MADGIVLRQVFHRVDEQFLPVYVAGIRSAFAAFIAQLRRDCNRKNFGHEEPN